MEFVTVATKAQAIERIAQFGSDGALMAGGTFVMPEIARGQRSPTTIIHLGRVAELSTISTADRPTIGCMVTHRTIATSSELERYVALRNAASTCGGWQTQNVGTIGGNLCNASPGADLMPPLLVHGARVTLESVKTGKRTLLLDAFVLGPRQTSRAADELMTCVDLDPMPDGAVDAYVKVRRRNTMDSPIVSLALRLTVRDRGGAIEDIRIAVAGAGPKPYRANEAEQILVGQLPTQDAVAAASEALARRALPIDDVRASAWYRLSVLPRIFARALREAATAATALIP